MISFGLGRPDTALSQIGNVLDGASRHPEGTGVEAWTAVRVLQGELIKGIKRSAVDYLQFTILTSFRFISGESRPFQRSCQHLSISVSLCFAHCRSANINRWTLQMDGRVSLSCVYILLQDGSRSWAVVKRIHVRLPNAPSSQSWRSIKARVTVSSLHQDFSHSSVAGVLRDVVESHAGAATRQDGRGFASDVPVTT